MAARWLAWAICTGLASASCRENTCPEDVVNLGSEEELSMSSYLLQRTIHFTQPKLQAESSLQMCRLRPSQQRQLSLAALRSVSHGASRVPNAKQQVMECVRLGSQIHRNSGDEVAPLFRKLDALQTSALEAQPVQKTVARVCIDAATVEVVFNRPLTMLMNRTTHTVEHIVQLLRLYPDDAVLNEALLQKISGAASACCPELTPFVARVGGFDVLFSALDRFKDKPDVMMSAWRGLSDHSHNVFGAEIIANHGGPMQGISWLVNQMRIHPEPGLAESPLDHLTLKYEIMQNVLGLLDHDTENKYGAAFIKEGFPEQLLYSMRVEPELRGTQDVSCQCMGKLLQRDISAAKVLVEGGAIKATVDAVKLFANSYDSTPWCGVTLGLAYSVVPACGNVLGLLARANPANTDAMLELGLLDVLKGRIRPIFALTTAPLRVLLSYRAEKKKTG